jgi:hypothetical protein
MMLAAVTGGVELAVRSLVAPGLLAARWLTPGEQTRPTGIPAAPRSLGLSLKVALDELFFLTEALSMTFVSTRDRDRIRREVRDAVAFLDARGLLADPARYHVAPPPPDDAVLRPARTRSLGFLHLTYDSGWAPPDGQPGRERWLGYVANRTAHAWVLEHPGAARPWLVCIPGYRMGHPLVDFTGFPAAWLHRRLGLNVAIAVLPLHGPRTMGRRSGDGFLSGDYLDTVHLQAQAVWDARRLLGWLRSRGASTIGVYGLSLGGGTSALLAALEDDLACVIAGIPATCFVGLARSNLPPLLLRWTEHLGLAWPEIERLCTVVSPLALAPRLARERRYLFAATADRLVPPAGVQALWEHWERPRLDWYHGSHVSFLREAAVRRLVADALEASGVHHPA